MSDAPISPEQLRLLCEQKGLRVRVKLFPDGVKAAAERGLRPVGDPPGRHLADRLAGAGVDPSRFEKGE